MNLIIQPATWKCLEIPKTTFNQPSKSLRSHIFERFWSLESAEVWNVPKSAGVWNVPNLNDEIRHRSVIEIRNLDRGVIGGI